MTITIAISITFTITIIITITARLPFTLSRTEDDVLVRRAAAGQIDFAFSLGPQNPNEIYLVRSK